MDSSTLSSLIFIAIQIIILEGILSIDNAAVLGALVSTLPTDKPVPFSGPFKFLQPVTNRMFGMQQSAALKVGLFGAYLGQALMLSLAAWISRNPFLKFLGAVYLIKLAFENLAKTTHNGDGDESGSGAAGQAAAAATVASFWLVVLNVELTDLAFSLDNVVAVIALSQGLPAHMRIWALILGVGLAVLLLRFAAGIFTWIIKHEPIVEQAAYLVVFNIGIQLLLAEFFEIELEDWQKFIISIGIIVLCVAYARIPVLRLLAPLLTWVGRGMGIVNEFIEWIIQPIIVTLKLIFSLGRNLLAGSKQEPAMAGISVGLSANPSEHGVQAEKLE